MEAFFKRNRNAVVLVALVFAQVIALATQVKRADPRKPRHDESRLLRIWAVTAISAPERLLVRAGEGARNLWHGYIDLRRVNQHNAELQQQLDELRMEQARLQQSSRQARRLEALLSFKEQYVEQSLAAQVIGTSGTDSSHILYIDKGARDGLQAEMPVITPNGIVGKLKEVYPSSAQVLLLNDQQSGVGVILDKSRRQGIMKGSASGELEIHYVMADEKIEPGEKVYTSGGDRIFPRGLEVGQVTGVVPDKERDGFQLIRVRPNANLFRLEEVLVVTEVVSKSAGGAGAGDAGGDAGFASADRRSGGGGGRAEVDGRWQADHPASDQADEGARARPLQSAGRARARGGEEGRRGAGFAVAEKASPALRAPEAPAASADTIARLRRSRRRRAVASKPARIPASTPPPTRSQPRRNTELEETIRYRTQARDRGALVPACRCWWACRCWPSSSRCSCRCGCPAFRIFDLPLIVTIYFAVSRRNPDRRHPDRRDHRDRAGFLHRAADRHLRDREDGGGLCGLFDRARRSTSRTPGRG